MVSGLLSALAAQALEERRVNARELLKAVAPPVLLDLRNRFMGRGLRFSGQVRDWAQAQAMSTGYSTADILERVVDATRAVVRGDACFERDSVLFDTPEYPFAVLTALLRAAALSNGHVQVLDFGGSLGSTYRQCGLFLQGLAKVDWQVVEQPVFVAAGRREFSTPELQFFESVAEVSPMTAHGVILACSVLQYLERPQAVIEQFDQLRARHLVIDRTPLSDDATDRLCIQHVPKEIYPASYPCWIFSRNLLISALSKHWSVLAEFPCAEGEARTDDGMPFEFRGLILEKRS